MKPRKDLLTGEPFVPTRITQKFANAENRILYHNQRANKLRHSIMFVDNPLRANLRILNKIMDNKNELTFHKEYLLGKGYTFNVMTHFVTHEEKRQPCIYHYIIITLDNNQVCIIKQKEKTND